MTAFVRLTPFFLCCKDKINGLNNKIIKCKKQQRTMHFAAFLGSIINLLDATCRDFRQRLLISFYHERDVKLTHGGHSLLPFSRENHACSRDGGCEAGMFFSFSFLFILLFIATYERYPVMLNLRSFLLFGLQNYL